MHLTAEICSDGRSVGGSVLRIDHCELCGGYIKTLVEDRSEDVFLADWTLIHLDIVAR